MYILHFTRTEPTASTHTYAIFLENLLRIAKFGNYHQPFHDCVLILLITPTTQGNCHQSHHFFPHSQFLIIFKNQQTTANTKKYTWRMSTTPICPHNFSHFCSPSKCSPTYVNPHQLTANSHHRNIYSS